MERKEYSAGAVKLSFWFMEFRKAVSMKVLQVQEAPVYAAIDEARGRTLEVLKEKPYADDKSDKYLAMYRCRSFWRRRMTG